jgi:hypothetical protein
LPADFESIHPGQQGSGSPGLRLLAAFPKEQGFHR